MKTFAAGLTAAYASGATTICACLRVARTDGVVSLFASGDVDVTVGGETYLTAPGFDISNLVAQAGLAVDNMELTVFPDETDYPQVDILAGRWDGAAFWLFECDYTDAALAAGSPVGTGSRNDINLLKRGTTGEADTLRGTNRFEFRSLKQALQQQLGGVVSKTCRYRLGSTAMPFGLCLVDLAPWTHTYLVTAVDGAQPRRIFTCSGAVQADEYFKEGFAHGDDAANENYERKIKAFAAGVFTLSLEMPFEVVIGDAFTFVAGCQKRLEEDCKDKFDNVLNFGGEPHVPGQDLLTADPEISV